jgi:hypothetical protein
MCVIRSNLEQLKRKWDLVQQCRGRGCWMDRWWWRRRRRRRRCSSTRKQNVHVNTKLRAAGFWLLRQGFLFLFLKWFFNLA